jgi:hypothetical protein
LKIPSNKVETLPIDTVVAVIPVRSLNASFGTVDFVDEFVVVPGGFPELVVDEQAAKVATRSTEVRATGTDRPRRTRTTRACPQRSADRPPDAVVFTMLDRIGDPSPCVVSRRRMFDPPPPATRWIGL